MRGWWITEEHLREQIRNCDEIIASGNKLTYGGGSMCAHHKYCVIRNLFRENPMFLALFESIGFISDSEQLAFVKQYRETLLEILEGKHSLKECVYEKAIEVEQT